MKEFSIIAAMDENRGIGIENRLPWDLKNEFKHFVKTTTGGTVIMGRRTWESLPVAFRPLKNRKNIIVTRRDDFEVPEGVVLADSLDAALKQSEGKTFVIGGATLYAEAISHPACHELILTEVYGQFDCDAFFPEIPPRFKIKYASELMTENEIDYQIFYYYSNV